jgi:DNA polymerase III epsilon subunit-like protein
VISSSTLRQKRDDVARVVGRTVLMKVFLDFEASSLADRSYPLEVAWIFQNGRSESHLILPAPNWTDWDDSAEAIHHITREVLAAEGEPYHQVAQRVIETLTDHDIFASAPSWDGKWLSTLLRAAGIPPHTRRLRDTDAALRETAAEILGPHISGPRLDTEVHNLVAKEGGGGNEPPAHRALPDAVAEYEKLVRIRDAARALIIAIG